MDPCERKLSAFFNHIIESDMALPELTDIDDINAQADVVFQVSTDPGEYTRAREWLHHWRAPDQAVTLSLARDEERVDEERVFLHFPGMARFAIHNTRNNGRLVTCHARSGLASATIRHLLLD